MTGHQHDPEDADTRSRLAGELSDELHQRVAGIHDAPFTFRDVTARAATIRRTRRLAVAAGVVAAAAVIVPVAVFAAGNLDRAEGPGPSTTSPSATQSPPASASQSPTPTPVPPAPTRTATPAAGELSTYSLNDDLAAGSPPVVPYLDGTALIRPAHDPVPLGRRYDQFVMLGDEVVGVYSDRGRRMLESYSLAADNGGSTDFGEIVEGIVVSDAGTTVAWSTPDGDLQTRWRTGDAGRVSMGNVGEPVSPAVVVGDGSCYEIDGGCQIFFNRASFGEPPRAADSHGIVDEFAPRAIRVEDVSSTGPIAVMNSSSNDGSCSGVYDQRRAVYLWKTCDYSFLEFSPNGDTLLATGAYRDGFGLTYVTALDAATGDPRVQFEIDRGAIVQTVWEDETHVLAVTYDDDAGWRMLRLGLDGSREVVAGPDDASQDERPFFLAGRP